MDYPENPNRRLKVVVVGAGMGGLACALSLARQGFEHVDVFESASDLGFVGAGIQLAPNLARVLDRLGCWKDIEREAVNIEETSIRQGSSNNELGNVKLDYVRTNYGFPHSVGHRSSLAGSMYEACKREKAVKFHFSTSCEAVNSWGPRPSFTARPRNGTPYVVEADVILAADGVKSVIRDQMLSTLGADAQIVDTGQAAYRIMLRREQMAHDAELLALIDSSSVTRWVGERRHIIAYPVSSKTIYNISTAQPDEHFAAAPSASYTTRGSKTQMLAVFADFCPLVHRMLNLVPDGEVCEWKLRVHSPLPTWALGSVALVGDACHPTLPHLAQGAAQAIEDAAVLGVVLRLAPLASGNRDAAADAAVLHRTLKVYEALRKERTMTLVEMAAASGRALHLGEGKAREERDRMFAALKEKKGNVPDKWADAEVQRMIYGFDCMKDAEDNFAQLYQKLAAGAEQQTSQQQPAVREQSRI